MIELTQNEQSVYDFLRKQECPINKRLISEALGLPYSTTGYYLECLVDKKKIKKIYNKRFRFNLYASV